MGGEAPRGVRQIPYVEKIIDLDRIEWPEERAGSVLEPHEYSVLKQTIATLGLLHDIIVMDCGRRIVGVAGYNRWRALREKGVRQMKVRVIPCDERLAILIELAENAGRGRPDPWGLLQRIKQLAIGYKMPLEEIAQVTGYSVNTLSKMLRVLKQSPPIVLELIRAGRLTVWHALELLRLRDPVAIAEYARMAAEYGWSVRETRQSVDRYLELRAERLEELNSLGVTPETPEHPEHPQHPTEHEEPATTPEPILEGEPGQSVTPETPHPHPGTTGGPQPTPHGTPTVPPHPPEHQPHHPQETPGETPEETQHHHENTGETPTCPICGQPIKGAAITLTLHKQCLINAAIAIRKIAHLLDKPPHKLTPQDITLLDKITELALKQLQQQEQNEENSSGRSGS